MLFWKYVAPRVHVLQFRFKPEWFMWKSDFKCILCGDSFTSLFVYYSSWFGNMFVLEWFKILEWVALHHGHRCKHINCFFLLWNTCWSLNDYPSIMHCCGTQAYLFLVHPAFFCYFSVKNLNLIVSSLQEVIP